MSGMIRIAVIMGWASIGALLAAGETYKLEEPADDVRVFGVGMRVQVNGKLQVGVGEGNKVTPLALNVSAALSYRERRLVGLGRDALGLRSIRDYEQTLAEIDVGEQKTSARLDERLKLIVAQGRPEGVEHYSLGGPLTTNELDLLRTPGDSLALPALLPDKEVAEGDTWSPPSWAAQLFAGMEAVTKSELKCTLESVKQPLAKIRIEGSLEGATGGAPTKIGLKGTMDYDLDARSITMADITQTEQRSVGAVSPGLDVSARVRLLRKPAQDGGRLADQKVIDAATTEPDPGEMFLRFDSPWNLSLLHSRSWHLFHQTEKVAIFRLLDQGALIAQCNLSAITSVKPGTHTWAEEFQSDIRSSLGENLKSMDAGRTLTTTNGRYVLQVTATGQVNDRPMTWIYYLIADPSGRQASLQVTLDSSFLKNLTNRERELVDSIRFVPANAAQSPAPRKQ